MLYPLASSSALVTASSESDESTLKASDFVVGTWDSTIENFENEPLLRRRFQGAEEGGDRSQDCIVIYDVT